MRANFTMPDSENGNGRKPSVFAASVLFFLAGIGKLADEYAAWPLVLLIERLTGDMDAGMRNQLSQLVYYVLFIVLPVLAYTRHDPDLSVHLRLVPADGRTAALSVLAAAAAAPFVSCVNQLWLILIQCMGGSISAYALTAPASLRDLGSAILMSAVLPGICEELLFRGMLLSAWEERGSMHAVISVSLLFTLLHGSLLGIPGEFICGVLLACIVISSGSLLTGMVFHTVFNSILLIASYGTARPAGAGAVYVGNAFTLLLLLLGALLFGAALMFLMKRFRALRLRSGNRAFGVPPCPEREPGVSELVVRICGVVIASLWYVVDLLRVSGLL